MHPLRTEVPSSVYAEPVEAAEPEGLDLRAYVGVILRYKWGILSLTAAVLLITALWVNNLQPVYRATATLLIEPPRASLVPIQDIYETPGGRSADHRQTQFEILKSRDLTAKAAAAVALGEHPEFLPWPQEPRWWQGDLRRYLPFLPQPAPAAEGPPAPLSPEAMAGAFKSRLTVTPIRDTQLVNIQFDAADPRLAAAAANALAVAYIESGLEARVGMTQQVADWLTQRLAGLRQKLEESERVLNDYVQKVGLIEPGNVRELPKGELTQITSKYLDARQGRLERENAYDEIRQAGQNYDLLLRIPRLAADPGVRSVEQEYLKAQQTVSQLSANYTAKHPNLIDAITVRDEALANLKRQLQAAVDVVRSEYELAKANEQSLAKAISSNRTDIQDIGRKEYQLLVLKRDVDSNRQLYDLFLTRFKETSATSDFQPVNARILDQALIPKAPYKPNKQRILIMALALGLLAGIGLALLLNALDNTFKRADDLEQLTALPVLGVVPLLRGREHHRKDVRPLLVKDSKSGFAESVRTVRTAVLLAGVDRPQQRLLVTSALPAEGKTSIAVNLALALGQLEKVLLIDADLRRPVIGQLVGLAADAPGLAELAAGAEPLERCLHPYEAGQIDVLPAGAVPPNPLELLSSQRFRQLLETLSQRYDRIVLDSPPCQAVSDPLALSQRVDGIVFVVKADATPRTLVQSTLRRLRQADAHVIGAVLNQFHVRRSGKFHGGYYHSYYYHGYHDYYGYRQQAGKETA